MVHSFDEKAESALIWTQTKDRASSGHVANVKSRCSHSHALDLRADHGNVAIQQFERQSQEEREERDTNKRVNGRDKTERTREELQKRKLDATLDGAHLDSAPSKPDEES